MAGQNEQILRIDDVVQMTRLGRSTVYHLLKLGLFPRPIKLGPKARGWLKSDLLRWIEGLQSA